MSFKNAVKLIIAKFNLVWSVLLYVLIVSVVMGGILYLIWAPTFHAIASEGYILAVGDAINAFIVGDAQFMSIVEACRVAIEELGHTVMSYPASIALTPILILVVGRIAYGLKDVAVCTCLDSYMSSNMNIGFWAAFFSDFRRSIKLVLSRTLFTVPFDALTMLVIWGSSRLLGVIGVPYLIPLFCILEWVALIPLKKLFFTEWPCYVAVQRNHTFSALRMSIRFTTRRSKRIYSSLFVTEILSVVINLLVGLFTLGAGLVLSVPLTITFEFILGMTILYNYSGRRYYLENGQIFTPEGTPALNAVGMHNGNNMCFDPDHYDTVNPMEMDSGYLAKRAEESKLAQSAKENKAVWDNANAVSPKLSEDSSFSDNKTTGLKSTEGGLAQGAMPPSDVEATDSGRGKTATVEASKSAKRAQGKTAKTKATEKTEE